MGIFKGKAVSKVGNGFEVIEAGNHAAVLVALIDLGTHTEDGYQGTPAEDKHKVMLVWELVNEKMAAGPNNHLVCMDYKLSFHKKAALRLLAEAVRGKPWSDNDEIDYSGMLGRPCQVTITHGVSAKGNTYAKVAGVSAPAKGVTMKPARNKPASWSIEDGIPALEGIASWVPFLRVESVVDVVKRCHELDNRAAPAPAPARHNGMVVTRGDADALADDDGETEIHQVDDDIAF